MQKRRKANENNLIPGALPELLRAALPCIERDLRELDRSHRSPTQRFRRQPEGRPLHRNAERGSARRSPMRSSFARKSSGISRIRWWTDVRTPFRGC